jgi:serine/threonine-protein kinase
VQPEPFGPYTLLDALGQGGMGVVYIARSEHPDHPLVALKRLRPDAAAVPGFPQRFEHECYITLGLRHPNVIHTLSAGDVDGRPYVAAELIAGKDVGLIAERLSLRRLGAPVVVAVRVMLDLLNAVGYIHQARDGDRWLRLVHRDVTPGNVIVGYDGSARLADFGMAKSVLSSKLNLTAAGTIVGTPRYMAPEVVRGQEAGPPADIYGVGVVMYRLLTGLPPYDGSAEEVVTRILKEAPAPLARLRPDLPPWLVAFVGWLMERDERRRPQSALAALDRLREDAQVHQKLGTPAQVASWLIDLFVDEHAEEIARYQRLGRMPLETSGSKAHRTRVINAPTAPLDADDFAAGTTELGAPLPYPGGAAALAESTLDQPLPVSGDLQGSEAATRAERTSPPPRPAPVAGRPSGPPAAVITRPSAAPPGAALRTGSLPPAALPEPLAARTSAGHGRASAPEVTAVAPNRSLAPWFLGGAVVLALAASVVAVFSLADAPSARDPLWRLAERYGAARAALAERRAQGIALPSGIDRELDEVRSALNDKDAVQAELEMSDVDLLLSRNTASSTKAP